MKFYKLVISCIFICQYIYAQSSITKNDLNITNKLLLQSSHYITENNLTMVVKLTSEVMKILFENNSIYDPRMIHAYNLRTYVALEQGNIKQAKIFIQKALNIQDTITKPNVAIVATYYTMAKIEKLEKNYTKAIGYYHKTIAVIEDLNASKANNQIKEESITTIKLLSNLAKDEIVYKENSFLDFVHKVKDNYPNITIQEFINKKNEHNESIGYMLKLCKKIIPEYLKVDSIYSEYVKNPSQIKENLFDFVKITNFNYLLNTIGVCSLKDSDKNMTQQKFVVEKLYKDLSELLKYSENPMELSIISLSYKKFSKIINELNYSSKYNKYLSKTDFLKKLQFYKDIQLKDQNPKLMPEIPENKKKLLFQRYEYFKNYFKEYFLTMEKIIQDNDYVAWDKYFNKLTLIIKNKNTIITNNGEEGRAKVWAAGVMLYFKSTLDNYNIFLSTRS